VTTFTPCPKPSPSVKSPKQPIPRTTWLKRGTKPIPRGKPPKPRNAKRKASEFTRAYGSKARVAWVKAQPCLVGPNGKCAGDIENHHVKTGGGSRRSDARFIVPICQYHHQQLHIIGRRTFEIFYNVHLETAAAQCELDWQKVSTERRVPLPVVKRMIEAALLAANVESGASR